MFKYILNLIKKTDTLSIPIDEQVRKNKFKKIANKNLFLEKILHLAFELNIPIYSVLNTNYKKNNYIIFIANKCNFIVLKNLLNILVKNKKNIEIKAWTSHDEIIICIKFCDFLDIYSILKKESFETEKQDNSYLNILFINIGEQSFKKYYKYNNNKEDIFIK